MNSQNINLGIDYLRKRPESAAHILESHDSVLVSNFLASVPASIATKTLQHMQPRIAARICMTMEFNAILDILATLDAGRAAIILRHFDKSQRDAVLRELPKTTSLQCKLSLNFAEDAVGAWMTSKAMTLAEDCIAKSAIEILKNSVDLEPLSHAYVVDDNQSLRGQVHFAALTLADPNQTVGSIMEKERRSILGRTPIILAAERTEWTTCDALPVVNRQNQFIGALRQARLREALDSLASEIDAQPQENLLANILEDYGTTLLASFHTLLNVANLETKSK